MTIIAGFVHSEGILLSADMEITTYTSKKIGSKLIRLAGVWGCMGIALSGNPDHAIAAVQKVGRELDTLGKRDLITVVDATLARFFKEHIYKHPSYATHESQLSYGLVLAVYDAKRNYLGLYGTTETTMREFSLYRCDGIGRDAANALIPTLYRPDQTKDESGILAAYVLGIVKKTVPGCGGPSMFLNVGPSGDFDDHPVKPEKVAHMEAVSEYFNQQSGRFLLGQMCTAVEDFERQLQNLVTAGRKVRAMWDAVSSIARQDHQSTTGDPSR